MNCENCGTAFSTSRAAQRFCSERCRKQAERRRHYVRHHLDKEKFELACQWCGKVHSRAAHTCSNECSQKRNRYRAYGVHSLKQLNELKTRAGGHCEICGIAEKDAAKGALHCDHDHATGKPRGMLCMNCNQALGKFEDNPELLLAAIKYLENP